MRMNTKLVCPKCRSRNFTTSRTTDIEYVHRAGKSVCRRLNNIAGYPWFFKCDECGYEAELNEVEEAKMKQIIPKPTPDYHRPIEACECGRGFKTVGVPKCGKCATETYFPGLYGKKTGSVDKEDSR